MVRKLIFYTLYPTTSTRLYSTQINDCIMTQRFKTFFLAIHCLIILNASIAQGTSLKPENHKMDWWKEARFGMFIHWGIYAVPAGRYVFNLPDGKYKEDITQGEWIMNRCKIPVAEYRKYAEHFNPTKFNAEEWVLTAKAAGQKYIVITAKHHDGFAMYKSETSNYNIYDATPFKRDPLKELAEACRKYGMKLGFYYSQAQDWGHKGGAPNKWHWDKAAQDGSMDAYIDSIAAPQVKELLTNYGDVAVLWWDTPKDMTPELAQKLDDITRQHPNLITNNRLGGGIRGDLETPEQYIPASGYPGRNWEVCMTVNDHWGYNAYDDNWKSTKELLRKLIDITSKGGNFLLNVGPTAEGIIPPVCVNTLKEMGDWLKINGDAIYGTTANPFDYLSCGRATRKEQKVYIHVFDWPKNGQLNVPFANNVTKAYLLEDTTTLLRTKQMVNKVLVSVPKIAPDKMATVVVLEFKGEPIVLPKLTENTTSKATSELDTAHGINKIFSTNPKDFYSAGKDQKETTIELDLGKPQAVAGIMLAEPWRAWEKKEQHYVLSYKVGNDWKILAEETTNGTGHTKLFGTVTTQFIRLKLNNKTDAPKLNQLLLYRPD